MKYALTHAAARDVDAIKAYLRSVSPDASRIVREELTKAFRFLARNPGAGVVRTDLTPRPLRFWIVYSYLIAYDGTTKPIRIVRVIHGARDLPAVLKARSTRRRSRRISGRR